MASPVNRHCANCIGTLSFPVAVSALHVISASSRSVFRARLKTSGVLSGAEAMA